MKRRECPRPKLLLASVGITVAFLAETASGLTYRTAGLVIEEVRTPAGATEYRVIPYNALRSLSGESPDGVFADWDSLSNHLFREWRYTWGGVANEEIYSFSLKPFAFEDVPRDIPAFNLVNGAEVSSPFSVKATYNITDRAAVNVSNFEVIRKGHDVNGINEYICSFESVGEGASITLKSQTAGFQIPSPASPVIPPPNASLQLGVVVLVLRATEITLKPISVPEPSGVALFSIGGVAMLRRRSWEQSKGAGLMVRKG